MATHFYKELRGLDVSTEDASAEQVRFNRLNNFVANFKKGVLRKRGGSREYSATGNIIGLTGYESDAVGSGLPLLITPIRHRRNGPTSYIEKFSWSTKTWSAITQGTYVNFGAFAVMSSGQVGSMLALFAGRPAKITNIASGSVTRLGGPGPTAAPTVAPTAGSSTLTGDYYYFYTFYDSTSGWESSPSPISAMVSPSTQDVAISALEAVCYRDGADKIRIYRTIYTGEAPFMRVAEVPLGAHHHSYVDAIIDDNLGAVGPDIGDNDPPPATSYLGCAHEGRLWVATGSKLYYSKPYEGSTYPLEQFSEDRVFQFGHNITGLCSMPQYGGLLVFRAPKFGIDIIQGRNQEEFLKAELSGSDGTYYHHSISKKDNLLTFWSDAGPRLYANGQPVADYDAQIADLLGNIMHSEFDLTVSVWSVWLESAKQFIYGFAGTNGTNMTWVDSDTGTTEVGWTDSETGSSIGWET